MSDNTIQGLRKNQWGIEAVAAQGTLTMDTQPTANDTITIGSITYTWKASGAVSGQINLGADLAAAKTALVAAINGTDSIQDGPNPFVSAADFSSDDCVLTARIPGTAGNSIATTETFTASSNVFDDDTLGTTRAGSFARGTAVAATSQIAIENLEWGDDDENIYRPQYTNGLLIRNRGTATPVQHGTRFTFSDQPVPWSQLPHWLMMAIEGVPGLTVSALGASGVWTFTRDPASNPNPASFTLERQYSNGLGDTIDQNAAYGMLSELTLRYAQNEHVRMSGNGFARKFASMGGGITDSLTLPDTDFEVSALSKVYVDSTWGAVGTTLLAEQVIGWEVRIGTGIMPRYTAEGRSALDFTKHQINGQQVMLSVKLTLLLDPTRYALEQTAAAAGTIRAFQIRVDGANNEQLKLNMMLQHTKPALFKIGEDEGQDIIEMELEEGTDQTNFLQAIATIPDLYAVA